jgi:uncharacterized protein (TIGR03118 family)
MSFLSSKARPLAVLATVASSLAIVAPAAAHATGAQSLASQDGLGVQQVNLVSDVPGMAPLIDPDLVNPWGLALTAGGPLWTSNQGTNSATLYSSAAGATTATKVPTTRVTVPAPTGQVTNSGTDFVLTDGSVSSPARFIFSTLTGQIAAWGPPASPDLGAAQIKATVEGAVYTGLAIAPSNTGDHLYAANSGQNRIDVFNDQFERVTTPAEAFKDASIPVGFAPFNVQALNGNVFVAYAKFDTKTGTSVNEMGLGYVDEYTTEGRLVDRVATRSSLNAPWGLAIAPASWGKLAGSLLIGNFGDGRINVVGIHNGRFDNQIQGQLRNNATGKALSIEHLWGLLPGTAATGGTDSVWFSAGIGGEKHGLVGVLRHP